MKLHSKDLCPCGSGKRYKHCHQPIDVRRRRNLVVFGAVVVVAAVAGSLLIPRLMPKASSDRAKAAAAAGDSAARKELETAPGAARVVGTPAAQGAAATAVVSPNGVAGPPLRDPNALSLKPPNSGAVAPGEHPKPWEYDVAHNRYYDPRPGHMHWHSGAPPADPNAAMVTPQVIATTPNGTPIKITTSTSPAQPQPAGK